MELLKLFFSAADFMPSGDCYGLVMSLIWPRVISDSLIFMAYMTIPFALASIARRCKDMHLDWIFVCFAVFIVACGTTPAMEVWKLWHAAYWLVGLMKGVTAAASIGTAILLTRFEPLALNLPGVNDLREGNKKVTSQSAAEHASELNFRGLLESAPDAMVIADAQGWIVLVNAETERMFGYSQGELLGQPVEFLVPERMRTKHPQLRAGYTANPHTRMMGEGLELRGLRKGSSEFPVEIGLSALKSPEGILIIAAIRDITARKESEEHLVRTVAELKRSNRELQQFAYVASHDLQEPLRMVNSYMQLLATRYKGRLDAEADEFMAFAVNGATRMQGMIRDLLAYSRACTEGGRHREISSENALQVALTNLQATMEESGAVVTHDALPAITTDDLQLVQVFQILVGNAIKYRSAETPRVHISAVKNGGKEYIFSVRDNGLGIDPQYFEKIFILFQRLHGRNEYQGTGIGLTICKKIVERLEGRIWVQSQLGNGSTFFFALPAGDVK